MIEFGEQQLEAISEIKKFISSTETAFTLSGSAGTGKTSIMIEIVKHLREKRKSFCLCAPTHQAKMILEKASDSTAITLHKLLSLTPKIDIVNFDASQLEFYGMKDDSDKGVFPINGIIICDESSMINDNMYDLLINKCKRAKSKVIFLGDDRQLGPVNSETISKVFDNNKCFNLTIIYRQNENSALTQPLIKLRNNHIDRFEEDIKDEGSIYLYNDVKEFLKIYIKLLKSDLKNNSISNKLLSYTNNRVDKYNEIIQRALFGNNDKFNKGQLLRCADTFSYQFYDFINSTDFIIEDFEEVTLTIPEGGSFPAWQLYLKEPIENIISTVNILNIEKSNEIDIYKMINKMENYRLKAVNSYGRTKGFMWKLYFDMFNSFSVMDDLMYQNRVIKRKAFDNGYALSIHKSQGSTYNKVFFDNTNVLSYSRNDETKRQLQYVGMSRTSNDIYILQK